MAINLEAMDLSQHMVWAALSRQDWWPIDQWPEWAQLQAVNLNKDDSKMYNFMYFLISNGLDPVRAARWTLATGGRRIGDAWDVVSDWPYGAVEPILRWNRDGSRYHAKRIRDTARVVGKALAGTLLKDDKRVYDMTAARPLGGNKT